MKKATGKMFTLFSLLKKVSACIVIALLTVKGIKYANAVKMVETSIYQYS